MVQDTFAVAIDDNVPVWVDSAVGRPVALAADAIAVRVTLDVGFAVETALVVPAPPWLAARLRPKFRNVRLVLQTAPNHVVLGTAAVDPLDVDARIVGVEIGDGRMRLLFELLPAREEAADVVIDLGRQRRRRQQQRDDREPLPVAAHSSPISAAASAVYCMTMA